MVRRLSGLEPRFTSASVGTASWSTIKWSIDHRAPEPGVGDALLASDENPTPRVARAHLFPVEQLWMIILSCKGFLLKGVNAPLFTPGVNALGHADAQLHHQIEPKHESSWFRLVGQEGTGSIAARGLPPLHARKTNRRRSLCCLENFRVIQKQLASR